MLEDADDWVRLEDGQQAITERNPNGITSPSMYSLISESEAQNGEMVLGGVSTSSEGGNFMGWLQKGWLNPSAFWHFDCRGFSWVVQPKKTRNNRQPRHQQPQSVYSQSIDGPV
ncbi:hypothetical protein E1B28_012962 [Marasmius oreades]|uniref:Uncharacterized protein n=1 Tax=Marasmius oreades TaxID=181124 RepID=A0A9P7RNL7_9AGAR|nr:uncharacterized protein E1B28_012962 [Marasmius oreades]KAG7086984.1 hypothetical protein E1B28_012962 [Marasmius oreades]